MLMKLAHYVAITGALLTLCASHVLAQGQPMTPEMRAAAYLASNCANCHGTAGRNVGSLPSLAGIPAAGFTQAMRDFREGKRKATIMHQLAKGYTDEQITAMANYFAMQKPK